MCVLTNSAVAGSRNPMTVAWLVVSTQPPTTWAARLGVEKDITAAAAAGSDIPASTACAIHGAVRLTMSVPC